MNKVKRIGILTGGGDCPGLNAVIRSVVHTAIRLFDLEVIGINDGFFGLVNDHTSLLEQKDVSGILPRGGTILGTSNRDDPFRFAVVGADGQKKYCDLSQKALNTIARNRIDALISVGGDGTQSIAHRLHEKSGLPVIGVPKTIDNDIGGTDVSFGFDTALQVATMSLDNLHSTAESHHRIMIIEVMGRYAGWIALQAGIAGGGDVILIPEIPFRLDRVVDKIVERRDSGKRFSLVVVSEGALPLGGQRTVSRQVVDATDPVRLGGISQVLGQQIEESTGMETRTTILGHLQRGGSPSPFDRILASRFGFHAVQQAVEGHFGVLVGLRGQEILPTPLAEAIAQPHRVDPAGDMVKTALALGTSFGI